MGKKVFGENRPIIVSTHSNTEHCHNHIAVCPYDLDGIRWHSNRKTLDFVRQRSDEICLEHGLDIIKNPKRNSTISYEEWDSRKKKCSWKVRMADTIDRLILQNDVTDISSLIEKMRECGYTFTNESRLIAKPKNVKYGCNIAKLGFGYSYQMLVERINNKQNELVGRNISAFVGFQVEVAVGIREKQYEVYRAPERNYPLYADLQRTVDVLNFVHNNHIYSLDDMEKVLKTANRMEDVAMNKYFKCEEKKQKRLEELHWKLVASGGIGGWDTHQKGWLSELKMKLERDISQLDSLAEEMGRASRMRAAAENASDYLEEFLKTDYDRIREREELRTQIEMYHEGKKLQEDGTYKAEPEPTAERNAELDFIEEREEQRRLIMEQRRMEKEMREREARRSKDTYCR